MTDESTTPPLRLVRAADPASPAAGVHTDPEGAAGGDVDPLAKLVQRIEDLPLRERPAAFERLNASLVAELNALEEA